MNVGEWQARITENFGGLIGYELYLYRRGPGQVTEFLTHTGVIKTLKEGLASSDNYFARFEVREQLQALAEAISSFGVKAPDTHQLEGTLEAQAKHLEDMRALVFKKSRSA